MLFYYFAVCFWLDPRVMVMVVMSDGETFRVARYMHETEGNGKEKRVCLHSFLVQNFQLGRDIYVLLLSCFFWHDPLGDDDGESELYMCMCTWSRSLRDCRKV